MSLWRSPGEHVYYGSHRTSVSWDELVTATAVAAGMLGVAWLMVGPTYRKTRHTLLVNAGFAGAVFVFVIAILGLTCKSWQSGTVRTSAPYSAHSSVEVNGTVGLYVGLTTFNVTLVGDPEFQSTPDAPGVESVEQINYNEAVDFGVRQGRGGYGEYSNHVNQDYRRLQYRGIPYPIAWVVELFTVDGDGLRWGRVHRQAGYYAHVLLWTSVPMWILTLATLAGGLWGSGAGHSARDTTTGPQLCPTFLLKSQLRPAAMLCTATGVLILAAPVIYALILACSSYGAGANLRPVRVHFAAGDLTLQFGWTFYLLLVCGFLLTALGGGVLAWCTCGHKRSLANLEYVWGEQAIFAAPSMHKRTGSRSPPQTAVNGSPEPSGASRGKGKSPLYSQSRDGEGRGGTSTPPSKMASASPPLLVVTSPTSYVYTTQLPRSSQQFLQPPKPAPLDTNGSPQQATSGDAGQDVPSSGMSAAGAKDSSPEQEGHISHQLTAAALSAHSLHYSHTPSESAPVPSTSRRAAGSDDQPVLVYAEAMPMPERTPQHDDHSSTNGTEQAACALPSPTPR